MRVVRSAVRTNQELFLVFKERGGGQTFPVGLQNLYGLHDLGILQIDEDHHRRIWTMEPSGWDQPCPIAVRLNLPVPLSRDSTDELYFLVGRNLKTVFSAHELGKYQRKQCVGAEVVAYC
jgi:hypothetical protein